MSSAENVPQNISDKPNKGHAINEDCPPRVSHIYSIEVLLALKKSPLVGPVKMLCEPPKAHANKPRTPRDIAGNAGLSQQRGASREITRGTRGGRNGIQLQPQSQAPHQQSDPGSWHHLSHGPHKSFNRDWRDQEDDLDSADPGWDDPTKPMVLNEGFTDEVESFEKWKRDQARKQGKMPLHKELSDGVTEDSPADQAGPGTSGRVDPSGGENSQHSSQVEAPAQAQAPGEYKLDIWGTSGAAQPEPGASRFSMLFGKDQANSPKLPSAVPAPVASQSQSQSQQPQAQPQQAPSFYSYGMPPPGFPGPPPGFGAGPPRFQRQGQFSAMQNQYPSVYTGVPPGLGVQPSALSPGSIPPPGLARPTPPAGQPAGVPIGLQTRQPGSEPPQQQQQPPKQRVVSDDDSFFMSMLSR